MGRVQLAQALEKWRDIFDKNAGPFRSNKKGGFDDTRDGDEVSAWFWPR